jgi:hypothetical protein
MCLLNYTFGFLTAVTYVAIVVGAVISYRNSDS